MKKFSVSYILLASILLTGSAKGVDTVSIKYFPLSVGNMFIYNRLVVVNSIYFSISETIEVSTISKDTVLNNKKFYYYKNYPGYGNIWVRTDSVTGSLYMYDSSNSCPYYPYMKLLDSLSANLHDSIRNCIDLFACNDTANTSLFGFATKRKGFNLNRNISTFVHISQQKYYVKNFGLFNNYTSSVYIGGGSNSSTYTLKGCVINGIRYGDTSTVSITSLSQTIPGNFNLYQNFPNPFNPSTTINFDIAKSSHVKIIVYDIKGRELEQLLNESINGGGYVVNWDGSNYPSGVYFYRMDAQSNEIFTETKRMILLK